MKEEETKKHDEEFKKKLADIKNADAGKKKEKEE